ncbi:MAG: hypothetical protein JOY93_11065 [Acidobacteriales bacterium]|nr:hypothetical protein [Terriglobales bacterium]
MKSARRTAMVAGLLALFSLAGSVFLLRRLDQLRPAGTLEDVLYLPSPKALKRLSLGYDGLMADVYWTRAVQYFGSQHAAGSRHFELLAPLLDIATTLDPHLVVAYEFGSHFLTVKPPNGAGMPQHAIELVKYGIRNNPDNWKLYYDLGFIYYMDLKDYAGAADAFAQGALLPGAHPWMKVLAGRMAEHSGETQTARLMWTATYQETRDPNIRANAGAHLRALQVDEDVTALEALTARYHEKTGQFPSTFADLEKAGMLRGVPRDPLGHTYKLMADGRIEVREPDDFPFIEKGTPPFYTPPRMPKFLPDDYAGKR